MSLRRRVIVGFAAVALVLIASNIALSSTFHSYLLDRVDEELVANARALATGRPLGGPGVGAEALTEYFVAVADPRTGEVRAVTSVFEDETPPPKLTVAGITKHVARFGGRVAPYTTTAIAGGGRWRMIAIANPSGYVVVLGASLDSVQETVGRMRQIQIFGSLAVIAALGFVSSWVMRLGVHPIAAMADTAEQISGSDDLALRVDHPDEATEAGRLGASFNAMLDRIQTAFRAREESEAKVRRFAADASHELRTPLTSIRGYAELYRAGGLRDEAAVADALARIEAEAARMGLLVDELLQLARLDREHAMEFHDVDLGEIATDAVHDARAVEPDRPITMVVEGDAAVVVQGHEPALRQILANLLANVRAHTPPDAAASVVVRRDANEAVLAVADEGPGMTDEVAAHVFDRFYRADSARTREHGGTGLGLAIVESIARAHGGSATVSSAPGEGSRFEVRLPISP